MVINKDTGN